MSLEIHINSLTQESKIDLVEMTSNIKNLIEGRLKRRPFAINGDPTSYLYLIYSTDDGCNDIELCREFIEQLQNVVSLYKFSVYVKLISNIKTT